MAHGTTRRPAKESKTTRAVLHAVSEVEHAVRPKIRSPRDAFSWLAGLTAGTLVAWRFIEADRRPAASDALDNTSQVPTKPPIAARHARTSPAPSGARPSHPKAGASDGSSVAEHVARAERAVEGTPQVAGPLDLVKEWYARFNRDECLTRSEALTFIAILSILPVLLLGLAVLGFMIHNPQQAAQYVRNFITHQFPGETAATANAVLQQSHITATAATLAARKWWAAILGILVLVPSALGLFVSAVMPMDAAWEVQETRGFIKLRLVCLSVMLLCAVAFVPAVAASSGQFHPAHASYFVNVLITIGLEIVAVALNSLMFTVIYKFLPNAPVEWRDALWAGLLAGVLWEIAKKAFEFYVGHFGSFNKTYGTLGGLAGLVTWLWYSSIVLLGCAIVSRMIHEHLHEGGVRHRAVQDPKSRERCRSRA